MTDGRARCAPDPSQSVCRTGGRNFWGRRRVLEIWLGERRWEFDDGPVVVGRAEEADVRIDDERVSRRHLEIRRAGGSWRVRDLGSSNGTFLDARPVTEIEVGAPVTLSLAGADDGVHLAFAADEDAGAVTIVPTTREGRVVRVGRARDNDVVLDDAKVSRYHAELVTRPGGPSEIRDLGSANGVIVAGRRVEHATVDVGTLVEIGDATLRVVAGERGTGLELVAQGVTQQAAAPPAETVEAKHVTPRERELLAYVAGGATDRQIADALAITVATVRSHLDRIHEKTGRRRRADLTRLALELGVEPRSPGG
jgi:pSer/pThr/pTyr-binding forkhead associated (FHA) protein